MDKPIVKYYSKEDIQVVWQASLCEHCAFCAKGLPKVFKPRDKPWIQPEGASKNEIIEQVEKCPSGALTWRQNPDK